MEAFIESFGLDANEFTKRLAAAHGLVAGSSVLVEFLRQAGQEPGFEPDHLDIWLYTPKSLYCGHRARMDDEVMAHINANKEKYASKAKERLLEMTNAVIAALQTGDVRAAYEQSSYLANNIEWKMLQKRHEQLVNLYCQEQFEAFYKFIEDNTVSRKLLSKDVYSYMQSTEEFSIEHVDEFTTAAGKKIQVITVRPSDRVCMASPREFIRRNFDLSCCMASWDPKTRVIYHEYPEFTLKRKMAQLNVPNNDKREARLQKYVARGFKLCASTVEPPTFAADSPWHKTTCMDIITFNEQSIAAYLANDEDKVVIKTGNQYYGFERKYLLEYLRKHTTYATSVKLYRMPMGQLIFNNCLRKLEKHGNYIFNATNDGALTYTLHHVAV
jgi:hypothetical protein